MLKRMWAIVISVVMLVTLCPTTSVFAEDAASKPTAIVENFDGKTVDKIAVTTVNTTSMTMELTSGDGIDGDALKLSNMNDTGAVCIGSTYTYSTDAAILEYDIKISKAPETSASKDINIAGCNQNGGANAIKIVRSGAAFEFWSNDSNANAANIVKQADMNVGEWYRVISTRIYSTATTWVLNSAGEVIAYHERTGLTSAQAQFCLIRGTTNAMDDGEILIDNIKFNQFNAETYGPSVTSSSIEDGAENVSRNTNSITVTTDSQIVESSMRYATLTSDSGDIVTCTMARAMHSAAIAPYAAGEVPLPLAYTITWSKTLNASDVYTLDLTKTKNRLEGVVDSTGVISFTTEEASLQETVLTDGFENTSLFTVSDGIGYYSKSDPTAVPFVGAGVHGVVQAEGYNGTTGAAELKYNQSNSSGSHVSLYSSSPYVLDANTKVVVNYRIKFTDAEAVIQEDGTYTGGNYGRIGIRTAANGVPNIGDSVATIDLDDYTGKGYIGAYRSSYHAGDNPGEKGFYYTPEKWYNVTYIAGTNSLTFKLTDIRTGELLFENSLTGKSYSSENGYYISLASLDTRTNGENGEGAAVTIDDIALWRINTSKTAHALTAQAPSVNANAVTLTFNQPTMAAAEMFAVSKDIAKNELVEADIDVKYTNFDTNVVTISGLDYGTTYYLSYDAVTSAGGAGFDPDGDGEPAVSLVAFTMPEPTASVMDKAAFTNGNVTLDYWKVGSEATATFIAAFYKGTTLVDVALLAEKDLVAKRNDVSFTAANVPADADGMIVYALEGLGSLVPLCVPTAKVLIN